MSSCKYHTQVVVVVVMADISALSALNLLALRATYPRPLQHENHQETNQTIPVLCYVILTLLLLANFLAI